MTKVTYRRIDLSHGARGIRVHHHRSWELQQLALRAEGPYLKPQTGNRKQTRMLYVFWKLKTTPLYKPHDILLPVRPNLLTQLLTQTVLPTGSKCQVPEDCGIHFISPQNCPLASSSGVGILQTTMPTGCKSIHFIILINQRKGRNLQVNASKLCKKRHRKDK